MRRLRVRISSVSPHCSAVWQACASLSAASTAAPSTSRPRFKRSIKRWQRSARDVGTGVRPGDRQAIAARDQRHAELALDAVEIAVALAEELRQQRIVVELHLQPIACAARRSRRRLRQLRSRSIAPARLLGPIAGDPHRRTLAQAARRRRRHGPPADRGCGRPAGPAWRPGLLEQHRQARGRCRRC